MTDKKRDENMAGADKPRTGLQAMLRPASRQKAPTAQEIYRGVGPRQAAHAIGSEARKLPGQIRSAADTTGQVASGVVGSAPQVVRGLSHSTGTAARNIAATDFQGAGGNFVDAVGQTATGLADTLGPPARQLARRGAEGVVNMALDRARPYAETGAALAAGLRGDALPQQPAASIPAAAPATSGRTPMLPALVGATGDAIRGVRATSFMNQSVAAGTPAATSDAPPQVAGPAPVASGAAPRSLTGGAPVIAAGPPTHSQQARDLFDSNSNVNFFHGERTGTRIMQPDGSFTPAQGQMAGTPPTAGGQARAELSSLPNAPDGGRTLSQVPGSVQPAASRLLSQISDAGQATTNVPSARRQVQRSDDVHRRNIRDHQLRWDLRTVGRGSPTMRRALMDQYAQEQRLEADAQQSGQRIDADMAMQAQRLGAEAQTAAANRQLTATGQMVDVARLGENARQFDSSSALGREQLAERARQFDNAGQMLTGDDGTTSIYRNDGTLSQVTDAQGQPFRSLQNQQGQITPAIQYQELSRQLQALRESAALNPNSGTEQQMAAIEAQMAQLVSGRQVQQGVPSGMEHVGTSGGKRVFRDASGNLHIED